MINFEITSFNALFAIAAQRGAFLDSFYQCADGEFDAAWRTGPRIPGAPGPRVRHRRPFDAARDALLALLGETAEPASEDLFG